jgi:hypothetical protein
MNKQLVKDINVPVKQIDEKELYKKVVSWLDSTGWDSFRTLANIVDFVNKEKQLSVTETLDKVKEWAYEYDAEIEDKAWDKLSELLSQLNIKQEE